MVKSIGVIIFAFIAYTFLWKLTNFETTVIAGISTILGTLVIKNEK